MRYYIKINLLSIAIILFCVCKINAHNALLFTEDNGDGTIYIEAGLSTGESAAGAQITIRDKSTGQPLSKFVLPDSGKINIQMPAVPYTITLDLGVGHIITKTGPFLAPNQKKDSSSQGQMPVSGKKSSKSGIILPLLLCIVFSAGVVLLLFKKKIKQR